MRSCVGNFDDESNGAIRICMRSIIFNQRVKTMGRYVIVSRHVIIDYFKSGYGETERL